MRKLVFISFIILLLGLSQACQQQSEALPELVSLVPPNTAVIVKGNLPDLSEKIQANSLLSANGHLPVVEFLQSNYSPMAALSLPKFSLLCFTRVGKEDLATSLITGSSVNFTDKADFKQSESYTYNGKTIYKYEYKDKIFYAVELPERSVFGDNRIVVENIIRLSEEGIVSDKVLAKVYKSTSDRKNSVIINIPEFGKIYSENMPNKELPVLKRFTSWIAVDADVNKKSLEFKGVTIPEKNEFLGLFKGTRPDKNMMAKITPVAAKGFYSFTYNDFNILKDNLGFYHKNSLPKFDSEIFEMASEIGVIMSTDGNVIALKSTSPELTEIRLRNEGPVKTFRGHPIYPFTNPDFFNNTLSPLIQIKGIKYYINIDDFFVFGVELAAIENIIAAVQSEMVLTQNASYKETVKSMDESSSLLIVGNSKNIFQEIISGVDKKLSKDYEQTDFSNYNYLATQFINHENFMYAHSAAKESDAVENLLVGSQLATLKPGEKIAAGPWFFENWRTKKYEIILQGASNTLYSFDENGILLWKTNLTGKILGDIQPIDIYKNGRIQMAFVTHQTFYLIDRDGKVVKPFGKNFDEDITQPLSVFDYNNNGRYRFPLVQGNKITMLDKELKKVTGFEFTSAESPVLFAPKHFRVNNKDFILIAETSGKLNLLTVQGRTRIEVKDKFDLSGNEWNLHKGQFTSSDKSGKMIQINTDGKLTAKDLKLDPDYQLIVDENNLVTLSGNKLNINSKRITLDYGLYTVPHISTTKNKTYISLTDTQSNKTYVFDNAGNLIPGFPVYGSSTADIRQFGTNGPVKLAVKGEEDSVLIYEVN